MCFSTALTTEHFTRPVPNPPHVAHHSTRHLRTTNLEHFARRYLEHRALQCVYYPTMQSARRLRTCMQRYRGAKVQTTSSATDRPLMITWSFLTPTKKAFRNVFFVDSFNSGVATFLRDCTIKLVRSAQYALGCILYLNDDLTKRDSSSVADPWFLEFHCDSTSTPLSPLQMHSLLRRLVTAAVLILLVLVNLSGVHCAVPVLRCRWYSSGTSSSLNTREGTVRLSVRSTCSMSRV